MHEGPPAPDKAASAARVAGAPRAPLPALPRGPIAWQLVVLALPMLGEQFLSFLVGLFDTYLAGTISAEATLAVGAGSYVGWFVVLAFTMVGIGSAALVSRSFGAKDRETADRTLNQAFWLAIALGALLSAAAYAGAPALAALLTQDRAAYEPCLLFLRVISLGYVLASVHMVGSAVLRASGDTLSPMIVMAIVNVVNVVVAAGLVFGWFGPRLGVAGIAIAALAARCAGGLIMAGLLVRGIRGMRLSLRRLRPDGEIVARILRVGLPALADSGAAALGQFLFIAVVAHSAAGSLATVNFAAHVIAMQVEAISYLPGLAIGTAAATLVGQYLGARDGRRATRAGHAAAGLAACWGVLAGTLFYFGARVTFALLSGDEAVRAVGTPALRLLAFVQPFLVCGIVYMSALRGAGDTRVTMVMSIACSLGLRVPVAYVGGVALGGGLLGCWLGMWADNVARALLVAGRFRQGGWRGVRV